MPNSTIRERADRVAHQTVMFGCTTDDLKAQLATADSALPEKCR